MEAAETVSESTTTAAERGLVKDIEWSTELLRQLQNITSANGKVALWIYLGSMWKYILWKARPHGSLMV
jgi:hypothetical protein